MVAILGRSAELKQRHRFSVSTLLVFLLAVFSGRYEATAQESTRSHRLLGNGLPTLSGGQSQMELLQRLQLLSGAAQSNGKTPEDSPLADPEAIRRLQEAMQSLQKLNADRPNNTRRNQQGNPFTGDRSAGQDRNVQPPQSSPPGPGTDSNSSEPDVDRPQSLYQRIAEQMGLRFDERNDNSPNGQGPPGTDTLPGQPGQNNPLQPRPTPQNGTRNIPPAQGSVGSLPGSEPRQQTGRGTAPNSPRPNNSVPQNGTNGQSSSRPGFPSTPRNGSSTSNPIGNNEPGQSTGKPNEPQKGSIQSFLDLMKGGGQPPRSQQRPSDTTGTSQRGATGTRTQTPRNGSSSPQSRTGNGQSQPNTGQGRDGRSTGSTTPPNEPSTPGRSWFPGGGISPPRSQEPRSGQPQSQPGNSSRPQQQPGQSTNGSDGTNRPPTDQQMPGRFPTPPGTSPTGDSTNSEEKRSLEQRRQDRLNAQREERLDEVRGSKKTLRQKLAEIAKLARSESDQADSSDGDAESETGDSLQSAFVDALADATKGLAEQVDGIVADERFSQRRRDRRPSRRERGGPFGQFAGLSDRANRWFVDSIEPDAPSTSILSSTTSEAGTGGSSISPGLIAGLFIVGGLGFWLLQRKRAEAQLLSSELNRVPAPTNLKSRQDIVQAFHDLAARCPGVISDWWTHDRAAQALATARPDVDDEVRQLAQLYEQARYLPDESSLTDEQLAAAKAAWLRCRKS